MSSALFTAAKAGKVEALNQLGALCEINQSTFFRLLPILLGHIKKPLPLYDITSDKFLSDFILADPVFASLEALASGLLGNRSEQQSPTYKKVREHWSPLCDWLGFAIKHLLAPTPLVHRQPEKLRIFRALATILIWISTIIQESEPILPCLVKLDIQAYICGVALGEWRGDIGGRDGVLNLLDTSVSTVTTLEYERTELIDALRETPNSISLIISDLKTISPRYTASMTVHSQFAPLSIIGRLASHVVDETYGDPRIRSLHLEFVANRSIPVIISLMNNIDETCTDPRAMNWTLDQLHLFSLYIYLSIEAGGPGVIAQAFDAELLRTMVRSFPLLSRAEEKRDKVLGHYCLIVSASRVLMPHPLVFRAARRFTSSPHWCPIPEAQNPIHEQWEMLQEAVAGTLKARREYKLKRRPICGNVLCPLTETSVNQARACGGCLSVHYCSKECQRQDWESRHKATCRPPPAQFSIAAGSFLMKDYLNCFFRAQCDPSTLDQKALACARGKYPVVVRLVNAPEDDDCGESTMSGESFL
ncbi:hypothetical protein C8J56DRAFT_981489 [Mycena floridula]|nr:hypothetical protein C8J56DRAFT_981489 [Mycena floridula]